MIADWLIIITAVVALWLLWKFMEYVLDLFAYAMNAVQRHEDSTPTEGKGSSS